MSSSPRAIRTLSNSSRRLLNTTERDRGKWPSFPRRPVSLVDNAPGWNEDLATASEAFVKADRETTTLEEMQKKTVEYVRSHHHDLEVEPTHATYAREEVTGPLGNAGAGVGEFEGVVGSDDLGPVDAQVESNGRVVTRRVTRKRTTVQKSDSEPGAG